MSFTRRKDLESGLEKHFRLRVRRDLDGFVSKLASGGGIPDRMILLPGGRIYLVELKTETGTLDPDQVIWHRKAAQRGVIVVVLAGRAQIDEWVDSQLLL